MTWGFCGLTRRFLGYGAPSANCVAYREGQCGRGDCIRDSCEYYEEREAKISKYLKPVHAVKPPTVGSGE